MSTVVEAATLHKFAGFKNANATQGQVYWASLPSWGTLCCCALAADRQRETKPHDL